MYKTVTTCRSIIRRQRLGRATVDWLPAVGLRRQLPSWPPCFFLSKSDAVGSFASEIRLGAFKNRLCSCENVFIVVPQTSATHFNLVAVLADSSGYSLFFLLRCIFLAVGKSALAPPTGLEGGNNR